MHTEFFWGNREGRDHLGHIGVDGKIILKSIIKKYDVRVWTGFNWVRTK
jgi:hypothetical protein